jgi:hypothetical protein
MVPRGGLGLRQLSPVQREAALALLATVLSPAGLEKVAQIQAADDDFKANGSRRGPPGGAGRPASGAFPDGPRPPASGARRAGFPPPPGASHPGGPGFPGGPGGPGFPVGPGGPDGRPPMLGPDLFGSDLYFISFLGQPSATKPWMLQFGGHHLALNVTIAGERHVLTPSLTGAQPAAFQVDGRTVRPLGRESDLALGLLQSLDDAQRRKAVLGYDVPDLVLGPGEDGRTIAPEGLKASEMSPAQRALLRGVIAEWAGIVDERAAAARMAQLDADLDQTWFAWSGPATGHAGSNITAYYRIQGPHLVIEYAPQHDEPDNHVHTIYRDPTDDYGRASAKP